MIPRSLIAADRRDAREHCRPLQAARQVPEKKLTVLNPILRLYRIQPTGKSFPMRVEMCWKWGSRALSPLTVSVRTLGGSPQVVAAQSA